MDWPMGTVPDIFKVWRFHLRRQPDHIDPVRQVVEAGQGGWRLERHHHRHRHNLQEDQQGLDKTELFLLEKISARAFWQRGPKYDEGLLTRQTTQSHYKLTNLISRAQISLTSFSSIINFIVKRERLAHTVIQHLQVTQKLRSCRRPTVGSVAVRW